MPTELDLRNPVLIGGLLYLITAPVHLLVPKDISVSLEAKTLCLIGGAYIGFGATVPRWYLPLCIVFDVAAAQFFIILYAVE
jgi:hypothetical protein